MGDQDVDDRWETTPVRLGIEILLKNSHEASEILRDYHFASAVPLPGEPAQRRVTEDSDIARSRVDRELATPYISKPSRALEDLGNALHVYQDSWSHKGTPDTPIRPLWKIHPEWIWSHPKDSGGWYSHDADLTPLHQSDAEAMAHKAYLVLQEYFHKNLEGTDRPA
jgi:hypothetical protein